MEDIRRAFEVYEELAKKYEEDWLRQSYADENHNSLDINLFKTLVKQVNLETMEKYQGNFVHISETSDNASNMWRSQQYLYSSAISDAVISVNSNINAGEEYDQ